MPPSTLGTLRTRVRTLIGDPNSEAFSNGDLNILCNDAWQRFVGTRSHQQQAVSYGIANAGDRFVDTTWPAGLNLQRMDLVAIFDNQANELDLNVVGYETVHWLQETEGIQATPRMCGLRFSGWTEAGAASSRLNFYPIPDDNNGQGYYDIVLYGRTAQGNLSVDGSVLYGLNYHEADYVARMAAADAMIPLRRSSASIADVLGPVPDGIKRNWVIERDLLVPDQPTLEATRDPSPPEVRESGLIAGLA